MDSEVVIIPFIFLSIGAVVAWAISNFVRMRMQEREMLSRERLTAMEKGINMPLLETPRSRSIGSPLRSGLVMIGVGIGVVIFAALSQEYEGMGVGAIIALAGVGNLVYWHLAGKREWETRVASEQRVSEAYVSYISEMSNKNRNN